MNKPSSPSCLTPTPNTHTLTNGLRIIHLSSSSEVVYCGYAIAAGTRHELPGEEGLAHFCEHMTFKGTEQRSSIQVINALERVGGELNAFTAKEETVYYAALLRQHFMKAVDLLTDIVFHSTYPQHEIDKEVEVVCDEIDSYHDSPAELIYDDFENKVFRGSALGHNVLGTKDSVRSFRTEDCQRFTQRQYRPDRMVFYVHGNIDFSKLISRLEKLCKDISSDANNLSTQQSISNTPPLGGGWEGAWGAGAREGFQSHVMLGTAFHEDLDRWRLPLYITNNILGGPSMNSRFNLSLRERRGLVYTVESMMTTYTDSMLWSVYFGCDKHDRTRCLRLVKSELQRLRRSPLSPAALAAAKRQLKGQIALASENRESYAIDMAKQFLHKGTLRSIPSLYDKIDKVTAEDIHALMNTILSEDRLQLLFY